MRGLIEKEFMGLTRYHKNIIHIQLTPEEEKQFDLAMNILSEKGCVNFNDPLNTDTKSVKKVIDDTNGIYEHNIPLLKS